MKNLTVIVALVGLFALFAFQIPVDDQDVRGNGNVITTTRFVDPFSMIEINGVFNIYLLQGDEELVKVETDENIQDYVKVRVVDGKLKVDTDDDINFKKLTKNNVYITLKDVEKVEINSVGKTECKNTLVLDNLKLDFNGVGKTVFRLDCNQLNADVSSVGTLILEGKAKSANIDHSGVGSLQAFDFIVDYLAVELSGVGSAEVNARSEISLESSGIGSIKYKGKADVVKKSISGIGSVRHVN